MRNNTISIDLTIDGEKVRVSLTKHLFDLVQKYRPKTLSANKYIVRILLRRLGENTLNRIDDLTDELQMSKSDLITLILIQFISHKNIDFLKKVDFKDG